MTERIVQNAIDIGIAGILFAALVVAFVWHADQRASIDAWKANRAELFQRD